MYIESMDSLSSLMSIKRHYKKDSRYVNDLYTLTYDNHESLYTTNDFISSLHETLESTENDIVSYQNCFLRGREGNIENQLFMIVREKYLNFDISTK